MPIPVFRVRLRISILLQVRDLSLQTYEVGDGTDAAMWQRFDKFNEKYEPFGSEEPAQNILKHDNVVEGRFLADITPKLSVVT